jgi:hypothetical protein
MIEKRVVLPQSRLIYEIRKGLATGHPFTSIINTLCSFGTFSLAMKRACTQEELDRSHLYMAGDDVIGKVSVHKLAEITRIINEETNNTVTDLTTSFGYLTQNKDGKNITFLKKKYRYGLISWNELELYTNLSFPTSKKFRIKNKIEDFKVMVTMAPFDNKIYELMRRCIMLTVVNYVYRGYDKFHKERNKSNYNKTIKKLYGMGIYQRLKVEDIWVPNSYEFNPITYDNSPCDIKLFLIDQMLDFERKRRLAIRQMLHKTPFTRFETRVRLKVFDVAKKLIKPVIWNNLVNWRKLFITGSNDTKQILMNIDSIYRYRAPRLPIL